MEFKYVLILDFTIGSLDIIELTDEELRAGAVQWEMSHSGISGRAAQQYINSLLSNEGK